MTSLSNLFSRFALSLTRERRLILRNGFLAALVMALVTLFIPNTYKSEARILPADARGPGGTGSMAAAAAAVGVSIPGQESADATYVDILKSRWVAKKLIENNYTFTTRWFYFSPSHEQQKTLYQHLKVRNMDRAIKKMRSLLTVSRDLKTKLISIVVETESPELSQQMVRKAVKSLDEFVLSKSRTKGGNKAIFTSQRLQEARASSLQAESEFREFINTNRNYSTSSDPKVRLQGQRLENELKLRQQILTTLSLNHEQALLEEKNDMPIINVLDEGDLPLEKSGPARTLFVLAAAILSGLSTWLWQHRTSIRQRLFPEEPVQG